MKLSRSATLTALITLSLSCLMLLATSPASAAVLLAQYDTDADSTVLQPDTTEVGVDATDISLTGVYSSTGTGTLFVEFDESATTTGVDYVDFTLTPSVVGETLDITAFNFEYRTTGNSGVVGVTASWDLQINVDGNGFVDAGINPDATYTATAAAPTGPWTWPSHTVTLSEFGINSIVFRLSMYTDGSSAALTNYTRINTMSVEGEVNPIPEPASLALLACGSLMLLRRRAR